MSPKVGSHTIINKIALAIFFICILLVAFRAGTAQDPDFWWHIALGKWELKNHSFLLTDIFSYTFPGGSWFNNTQLFDVPLYLLYDRFSIWGVYALRAIIFALSYFFLYKTIRLKKDTSVLLTLGLFIITIPVMRQFARPEITQPLFVALDLYLLYSYHYTRSRRIFFIPLVQLLWTNFQGGYVFGPTLIGIFLISEIMRSVIVNRDSIQKIIQNTKIKIYALVLSLSLITVFMTPYGLKMLHWLSFFFLNGSEVAEASAQISEQRPQTIATLLNFGTDQIFKLLFIILLIILITRVRKLWRESKGSWAFLERFWYEDFILLLLFLYTAIEHSRLIPLFTFISCLFIAKHAKDFFTAKMFMLPAVYLCIAVAIFDYSYTTNKVYINFPEESVQFIKDTHLQGNLLNYYEDGGYLMWHLYPQLKVFIDGRTPNLYDINHLWYIGNMDREKIWETVVKKFDITIVLLPPNHDVIKYLRSSKDWSLIFFDNYRMLYVKKDRFPDDFIKTYTYKLLNPNNPIENYTTLCDQSKERDILFSELTRNIHELKAPGIASLVLAEYALKCPQSKVGDYKNAERLLHQMVKYKPYDAVFLYTLARIEMKLDKDTSALDHLSQVLKLQKDPQTMTAMGVAYYNLGQHSDAEKIFLQVANIQNQSLVPNEYFQIFGKTSYQLYKSKRAAWLLQRYIDMTEEDKITSEDYYFLSLAYRDLGATEQAETYLQKSKEKEPGTN